MTEAVYCATAEYVEEMRHRPVKHHVSVSGVLKHLGVSRSGYQSWKKRVLFLDIGPTSGCMFQKVFWRSVRNPMKTS